ncbi:nucleoid-associated protein [Chitinophagaceae bacterium MMS25-I14]
MFAITDIRLEALATHYVGNKANGEDLYISKELVEMEEYELKQTLLQYFLTPFQQAESFNFWHPSDLKLHEIMHFASAVFDNPDEMQLQSANIARHLYEATNLPNIKSGELHVAYFKGCPIDGRMVDALGIYKTESKERFLKVNQVGKTYKFEADEGISPSKMDKGCLIFNTDRENGFKVHVVDKTNKGGEAQFWKDIFLKVRAAADEYHATHDYLKLCKDFIVDQIPGEYEVSKVEQIDFLNKSVDYFKKNEQFSKEEFEQEVFKQPELIESFRKFEKQFEEDYEIELGDSFEISSQAVKKQARVFKSVIKLDKNFHVYVHGNSDLIEKGYDPSVGMSYYKIYFEEEN